MIYKIDHYYNLDHDNQCVLIKSDIEAYHLVKILASIQFAFEDLIDESVSVDGKHILQLLKEFYNVEDVKDQYNKYLPYTHLNKEEWEIMNIFHLNNDNFDIIQIDLYGARESCCGPKYSKIMEDALPKDKSFFEVIEGFKEFYS